MGMPLQVSWLNLTETNEIGIFKIRREFPRNTRALISIIGNQDSEWPEESFATNTRARLKNNQRISSRLN